jgi:hypothetical protein
VTRKYINKVLRGEVAFLKKTNQKVDNLELQSLYSTIMGGILQK